jgi:hypothetical protein
MKRSLIILGAVLAYFLLCSKSCVRDEKEEAARKKTELTETKAKIKNEFESDDLSRKSLKAFEGKAEQKLVDFSDYLRIYIDNKLDTAFKLQARKMISDLFISDSVEISSALIIDDVENLSITDFLGIDSSSIYQTLDITFDSIEIAQPFRRIDDLNYKGRLSFSRLSESTSISGDHLIRSRKMEADIFTSKVSKTFGQDTLLVWSVFLGNIR